MFLIRVRLVSMLLPADFATLSTNSWWHGQEISTVKHWTDSTNNFYFQEQQRGVPEVLLWGMWELVSEWLQSCGRRRFSQVNPIMVSGNLSRGCCVRRAKVFNKNNYWNHQPSASCPGNGNVFCSNLRLCGILLLQWSAVPVRAILLSA